MCNKLPAKPFEPAIAIVQSTNWPMDTETMDTWTRGRTEGA